MKAGLGPDFFIVGAPKCGTTSLDTYLGEHPSIFMAKKEQHFFGSDLASFWQQPSEEEYFSTFSGAEIAQRRGEASGWYLLSQRAAEEIHAYNPDARIIAALRNPLEMLPSLYSQFLYDDFEDIASFEQALAAESERRLGRCLPPGARADNRRLLYREVVRFDEQLERYFSTFGRERVHVVLFDELAHNPGHMYRKILAFLDVDMDFVPSFDVLNPQKRVRVRMVQHAVECIADPDSLVRRIGTRLMPVHRLRSALLTRGLPALERVNTSFASRVPTDANTRAELAVELSESIDRLGRLLGVDLSHWYRGAAGEMPVASSADGEAA